MPNLRALQLVKQEVTELEGEIAKETQAHVDAKRVAQPTEDLQHNENEELKKEVAGLKAGNAKLTKQLARVYHDCVCPPDGWVFDPREVRALVAEVRALKAELHGYRNAEFETVWAEALDTTEGRA